MEGGTLAREIDDIAKRKNISKTNMEIENRERMIIPVNVFLVAILKKR